jgi:type IV secretory pathway TrbD component
MRYVDQVQLVATGQIVEAPIQRACEDQTFGLPTGIYIAMVLMFGGSVAVLSLAFTDRMAVSFGVIFAFLAMFFAIPAVFPRMARHSRASAAKWEQFVEHGIDTATGHASAASATVLILLLPALILCFSLAVAVIAAIL